jgi:hypothetical protein
MRRQVRIASSPGRPSLRKNPLLDVDRQGEEVEVVLGVLAGRGGRQEHGVVVEVGGHRTGGLAGEEPGLELDGARAELAVVENGLDGRDDGFSQGFVPVLFAERSTASRVLDDPVFDRGPQIPTGF